MSIEAAILFVDFTVLLIASAALWFAEMTYSRLKTKLDEIENRIKSIIGEEAPDEH